MPIYYFGYGSNMSQGMMREWCDTFELIGKAYLEDWALKFTRYSERWQAGVADIVREENSIVWGGLYKITEADVSALDRKEGNGAHYQRIEVDVIYHQQAYRAYTYEVIDKSASSIPTSKHYRDTMLTGARDLDLPSNYIQMIEAIPVTVD